MTQSPTTISEVIDQLTAWLGAQMFTPAVREISNTGLGPPSMYPHIAVVPLSEEFHPGQAEVTARLNLKLSASAGRPRDALATVRSLAHQIRVALNQSHGLGGITKLLVLNKLDYSQEADQIPAFCCRFGQA